MTDHLEPPGGEPSSPPDGDDDDERWLTAGVGSVAAASFFSDSGHEIATAVLPSFLTSVLHGSAAALGLIEGVSDALAGVAKLIGGPLANDPKRRQAIATGGYLGTAVATAAIGLAAAVWQVGVLRAIAWVSRGLRSPARDTLLSSLAQTRAYGRAFGLERAGDNLGAVVGPLAAAGLVAWLGIRPAIWFALIPGALAAVAITVAAREARRHHLPGARQRIRLDFAGLRSAGLLRPLIPVILFECGNIATTMLILRSTQLLQVDGRSAATAASLAILIYAAHNAAGAIVAYFGGRWIDRSGPRIVFAAGAVLYVVAYVGFAWAPSEWWFLVIVFSLAGAGIGLAETAESTLVAQILPDRLRGSGFGVIGAVQAGGNLVGTVVVGVLYTVVSPTAGFIYAAAWMALSVVTAAWLRGHRPQPAVEPDAQLS
ncbi:MFS transporter [Glaciibacter psychrotolerans]|uniref:MFS family permease n=1 Tax=Glaciibacter psychrotolerans TaxID=670054 RepID=A0A7Z0EFN5_9MICO|nr:MFS transporter [Leifsonia psychrotolerans]NYJ20581.1 MFS family permease [Leifsonia psychrotolerans]